MQLTQGIPAWITLHRLIRSNLLIEIQLLVKLPARKRHPPKKIHDILYCRIDLFMALERLQVHLKLRANSIARL